MADDAQQPRRGVQEVARFDFEGFAFTLCISLRGRLEIEATDGKNIYSASFSSAEALSLSAGSLSADAVFAFLRNAFTQTGGRTINLIKPSTSSDSLVLLLTGQGILKTGGYSFRLPRGRRTSMSISPSWTETLRTGSRSKNNPVIKYYERIRASKRQLELVGSGGEVLSAPSPTSSRAAALSQVVVPDEEAIAAYKESILEAKNAKIAAANAAALAASVDSDKIRSTLPADSPGSRGSSPNRGRITSNAAEKRGSDPVYPVTTSPASKARTISAARSKAESAFRTASLSHIESDPQAHIRHLYVDFRLLPQFPPGSDIEVVVTLCSKDMREHLTEPFYFIVGSDGKVSPQFGGKSTRTVFRELPMHLSETYMLIRMFRKATVTSESSSKSSSSLAVRRPYAIGFLDFSQTPGVNRIGQDIVETIPLFLIENDSPSWRQIDPSKHDLKPVPSLRPIGVALTSLPMADHNAEGLLASQKAAEVLADTLPTYPLQAVSDSSVDPQPIQRNDLYITLLDAQLTLKKPNPIEVCAKVTGGVDPKQHTPLSLRRGAGAVSSIITEDVIAFHAILNTNQPKWDETVVLRIPNELLRHGEPKIPVVFSLSVYSIGKKKKKEVCKGQIVLADTSGPISNGAHSIPLAGSGVVSSSGTDRPQVKIRTLLIRTSSSTATIFNRLAGWRTMRLDDLMELIQSIPQSIAELPYNALSDTLEALVGVLDTQGHEFVSSAVISAFCATVGTCTDEKQPKQFLEALDNYIDAHCTGMKHPERLYGAMAKYLEKPKDKRSSQLMAALRSLTYISRICALSAFAQPDGSPPPGPALFKSPSYIFNLDLLLRRLIDIITSRDAELYSAQIAALRGIPMLLDHVAQIVKARDAASLISMLITEINPETAALVQEKVRLIDSFARSGSPVLEDIQIRSILWPTLIRETIRHIKVSDPPANRMQLGPSRNAEEEACRLAVVALHQLIDFAQSKSSPDEVEGSTDAPDTALLELLVTTAAPAVGSVIARVPVPTEPADKSVLRYDMAMAFLAVLYVVPAEEFHRILGAQPEATRNSIISSIVEGVKNLLSSASCAAFPPDWGEMIQFQYRATETCLAAISSFLCSNVLPNMSGLMEAATKVPHIPAPSIGAFGAARTLALRPLTMPNAAQKQLDDLCQILRNILNVMATYVLSPQLDASSNPGSQMSEPDGLLGMASELKETISYSISAVWNNLGSAQIDFLEPLMKSIILLSLAKEKAQKKTAKMMIVSSAEECRQRFKESSRIVSLFLEALSRLFSEVLQTVDGTIDSIQAWAQPFVVDILGAEASKPILPHIATIIALLYDIEMTPPELDIDERVLKVANLIELLTLLGERRALSFHLSSLASLHLQCGTTVEAGYVLATLAEYLPWGPDPVEYLMPHELIDSSISQNRTTHTSRKIRAITEAMELLAMGAQWEEALSVSMPLAAFFDAHFRHSDYLGVAKKQLMYVEAMTDPMRVWPSYWYIKFSGAAFPEFTQSSAFVIANYALESQQDMMKRLQSAYPSFPINYGVSSNYMDAHISRIDVCEVVPFSADAIFETECLSDPAGPYAGADASVAQHRMRRRARHWRCSVREGDKELDYEFETLLSFPALIPRLPIVSAKILETRSLPSNASGRLSPPIAPTGHFRKFSATSLASTPSDTPASISVSPSVLIPSLTPKERTPSRAGSANRAAIQLSLPASQMLQQQIIAAQQSSGATSPRGVSSPRGPPPVPVPPPAQSSSPIPPARPQSPSISNSSTGIAQVSSTLSISSAADALKRKNSIPKSPRTTTDKGK